MRSLVVHLIALVLWFAVVCTAFGQDVRAVLREKPRVIIREEPTASDPLFEPGWTLEKDGSYVRTLRRATPKATPKPTPQTRPEAKTMTARSVPQRPFPPTASNLMPTTFATGVAPRSTSLTVGTGTELTTTVASVAETSGDTKG